MEKFIVEIEQEMLSILNNMQMEQLHKVLLKELQGLTVSNSKESDKLCEEVDYCNLFICAKQVEGFCLPFFRGLKMKIIF
ncbi:hypothetical protein FDB54_10530 [Clostridium botulinum]|nr:hypothetical protein [Clostridium botulinum]